MRKKQLTKVMPVRQETQVSASPEEELSELMPLPVSHPLPPAKGLTGFLGDPRHALINHAVVNQAANGGRGVGDPWGQISFDSRVGTLYNMDPNDAVEAHVVNQISMVNEAMIDAMRRLTVAESLELRETYSRMLNQLGRTSAALVQTLGSYRGRGEQRITVQHVNVNEGGQAIVGNIAAGVGGNPRKGR